MSLLLSFVLLAEEFCAAVIRAESWPLAATLLPRLAVPNANNFDLLRERLSEKRLLAKKPAPLPLPFVVCCCFSFRSCLLECFTWVLIFFSCEMSSIGSNRLEINLLLCRYLF